MSTLGGEPNLIAGFQDSVRIQQFVDFANAHRSGATPSGTIPAPDTVASFYDGSRFVGSVGVGKDFVYTSCDGWRGEVSANPDEIEKFRELTKRLRFNGTPE
jgi:hypothetical protein